MTTDNLSKIAAYLTLIAVSKKTPHLIYPTFTKIYFPQNQAYYK